MIAPTERLVDVSFFNKICVFVLILCIMNLLMKAFNYVTSDEIVEVKKGPEDEVHFDYKNNNANVPRKATSITIHPSVTTIEEDAFTDRTSMTSISIPNSVRCIEECAFWNCSSLRRITIPDSVTEIGYRAFYNCSKLVSISLSKSMTNIENATFIDCTSLQSIAIPDNILKIGNRSFRGCTSLRSVTIPNSVTSIGKECFYNCISLGAIEIPNSITIIDSCTFLYCSSLISVVLPASIRLIKSSAFGKCSSLVSIAISELTSLEHNTFYGCETIVRQIYETRHGHGNGNEDDLDNDEIELSLKQRFADLPLHRAMYHITSTRSTNTYLTNLVKEDKNKLGLNTTDAMHMTPLHVLCCNPSVTREMIHIVKNAYPDALLMKNIHGMTPLMMYIASRGLRFPNQQKEHLKQLKQHQQLNINIPSLRDLFELGVNGDEIELILSSFDHDYLNLVRLEKRNEESGFFPLLLAASTPKCSLDAVFSIAKSRPDLLRT